MGATAGQTTKSGVTEEPEPVASPLVGLLLMPLFIAAGTVLALIVSLHLMYKPWLQDGPYRQYALFISCFVTMAAFLTCSCIACHIRSKNTYEDRYVVTEHTCLVSNNSPLYVDVEAQPVFTKPAAG